MVLARWQGTIVDEAGNVLPGASVEVRSETAGNPLASLFSDRAGTAAIANPATADGDGFAFFHTTGGAYRILTSKGGFSREWRYVPVGLAGESDGYAAGIPLRFSVLTSDADPSTGIVRLNNTAPGSVTQVFIDDANLGGSSIASFLNTFDDQGGTTNRGTLYLQSADGLQQFIARVTGSVVDGSGYKKLTVTPLVTTAIFTEAQTLYLTFVANGNDGTNGTNGITPGVQMTFDSSTSMADPGAGLFRLNNATLASVTAAALDDLSSITGTPDISNFILSWDDSTQTTNRGYIIIKKASAPQNYVVYRISGTTTDNVGWSQLALAYVSHSGSFTAADICILEFYRSSDAVVAASTTVQGIVELATAAEALTGTDPDRAVTPLALAGSAIMQGKHTIWIPATALVVATGAAGPSLNTIALAGSLGMNYKTLDFDTTTEEYAYFSLAMPKSWNAGQITMKAVWSHAATATNFGVVWDLYPVGVSDNETLAAAASTTARSTDTGGTTNNQYTSPESSATTVTGAAKDDLMHFRFNRVPADGSDTLAIDARLHGVIVHFTSNAPTDA